jgi:DNA invertase Pin-like site-specific DNA recombinase
MLYGPTDPMGKMIFDVFATFAEFEVDLLRLWTREGMAIARSKGKLRGKQPKPTTRQQAHLVQLHTAGEHTIAELAERFAVSRPTVYRVLGTPTQQHHQHLTDLVCGDSVRTGTPAHRLPRQHPLGAATAPLRGRCPRLGTRLPSVR